MNPRTTEKSRFNESGLAAGRSLQLSEMIRGTVLVALVATSLLLSGCSLIGQGARPDKTVQNHVRCALDYLPVTEGKSGHDLLFMAQSYPWRIEEFYMSLPDGLFHMAFAPGRHLTRDALVEGATCSTPSWKKGFRLPAHWAHSKKWLLCTRTALEAVLFEVQTKWGTCSQSIPSGDLTARELGLRKFRDLPRLGSAFP